MRYRVRAVWQIEDEHVVNADTQREAIDHVIKNGEPNSLSQGMLRCVEAKIVRIDGKKV